MAYRTTRINQRQQGFTLVELLLAITLLLGLIGALVFGFSSLQRNAQLDEGLERVETTLRFARAHAAHSGHKVKVVMATESTTPSTDSTSSSETVSSTFANAMRIEWEPDPIRAPGVFAPLTSLSEEISDVTDLVHFRSIERESPQITSDPQSENSYNPLSDSTSSLPSLDLTEQEQLSSPDSWPTGDGDLNASSVIFYPDGSCDGALITLASRDSEDIREVSVQLQSVTGTTRRHWRDTASIGLNQTSDRPTSSVTTAPHRR